MAAEAIDRGGSPILSKGFFGGSFQESRVGIPPSEYFNIGSAADRQIVFYSGMAELGGADSAYQSYWRAGGVMSSMSSEFSVAIANAKTRAGVVVPEEVKDAYDERIVAFSSCLGLASGIMHCDGTMAVLAEQIIPQEHELAKGWDEKKAEIMRNDPAIAFPLEWIRQFADRGTLPYYWKRESDGDPKAIGEFKRKTAAALVDPHSGWDAYRIAHDIPEGVEESLVTIALGYFIAEDLPAFQTRLATGVVHFTDPRAPVAIPDKSDCGFLPFDNVYYATLRNPVGILEFKQIFPNQPEIKEALKGFFSYSNTYFAGRVSDESPSQLTVKDLKRQGKVWDLLVGGSQGTTMADFSKFGEAIYALCNLYNMPGKVGDRADVVGWMVGEAVYIKTLALMSGVPSGQTVAQLARVLSLGQESTVAELERVSAGVLGEQGVGFYGAMQVASQFGLRIGTDHYNQAVAMLKTGIKNPKLAREAGQPIMVGVAAVNRLFGGGSGKKRR